MAMRLSLLTTLLLLPISMPNNRHHHPNPNATSHSIDTFNMTTNMTVHLLINETNQDAQSQNSSSFADNANTTHIDDNSLSTNVPMTIIGKEHALQYSNERGNIGSVLMSLTAITVWIIISFSFVYAVIRWNEMKTVHQSTEPQASQLIHRAMQTEQCSEFKMNESNNADQCEQEAVNEIEEMSESKALLCSGFNCNSYLYL